MGKKNYFFLLLQTWHLAPGKCAKKRIFLSKPDHQEGANPEEGLLEVQQVESQLPPEIICQLLRFLIMFVYLIVLGLVGLVNLVGLIVFCLVGLFTSLLPARRTSLSWNV